MHFVFDRAVGGGYTVTGTAHGVDYEGGCVVSWFHAGLYPNFRVAFVFCGYSHELSSASTARLLSRSLHDKVAASAFHCLDDDVANRKMNTSTPVGYIFVSEFRLTRIP